MSIRRQTYVVLILIASSICAPSKSGWTHQPGSSSEWRSLYNGRSLEGWDHVGPGKFVVENGLLRTEGGMGLLWFPAEKFGNCVIRVVYKTATERANSGLYVRVADKPDDPWFAVHHGFEVQIADFGSEGRSTGSIYSFSKATAKPSKSGEWNTLEVTLNGNRIVTSINGTKVSEFDSSELSPDSPKKSGEGDPARGPRPALGYIGLQNHDPDSVVFFKEVSVKPL
jgi:hypothetical protein